MSTAPTARCCGRLLLDPQGEVSHADEGALALLALPGSPLRLRASRLLAPEAATELREMLAAAARGTAGALALPRRGRWPLTLRAEPARAGQGCVRVTLRDPALGGPDAALLAGLFQLTPTEVRVALALVAGRSPREICAELGVQPNTVKSHLQRLLAKSGTRRQGELVSLLLRSAAVVDPPAGAGVRDATAPALIRSEGDALRPDRQSPRTIQPRVVAQESVN